jgi:hypothetical protein
MSALFSTASGADVRVRFCPSPTGTPHVGLIRTALFNWAFARHNGGKLVFRIEDTDAARDSEESYLQLLEALKWLNIDWDEGIDVGGPHEPYRQSQRSDIYQGIIDQLVESGHLYESFATGEEIEARNIANGRDPKQGYDNFERHLTDQERAPSRPRVASRRSGCGCRTTISASTTWCAGTSPSRRAASPTSWWCARTASRSTPSSTRSTMRSWASRMCSAVRTCSRAPRARSRSTRR